VNRGRAVHALEAEEHWLPAVAAIPLDGELDEESAILCDVDFTPLEDHVQGDGLRAHELWRVDLSLTGRLAPDTRD